METPPTVHEERAFGLAGWVGQSRGMALAHRHLDLEINYVLAGTMTYLVGGRIVDLPPHRLCLLWGGVPHQAIRRAHPVEAIWVTIPLTVVLRWGLPDRLIRPLLATGFLVDTAPRPDDLGRLQEWLEDLPGRGDHRPPPAGVAETVLLEIQARLGRFARALSDPSPPEPAARSDHGLEVVEAMARFIARNFRENIGVGEITGEAHLHPNYAMTLFRRHTGMTLSQYVTLQRVAHAQRRLATSGDAIQEIAFDSGFGSVSRFYEAFRQQTGNSPRRFRLQMAATARRTHL